MAEKIGRLGFLGLAIEAVPGTPEATPDIFVPFTDNNMRGHHEPLADIAARTSRIMDYGSVQGKRWGEGSVTMYLDSLNAGYLLKMAMGAESRTQKNATPPVHDHLFTATVSGNVPTAATLWHNQGVDTQQYSYTAIDGCEVEVKNDGIATITADLISKFPATVSAPALTTTSGTLYTWKDMNVRFGTTVSVAKAATPTKLINLKMHVSNNVSSNYKSGSNSPDTITLGSMQIKGEYTLFFESVTDRDNYLNLVKQSMVITLTGASLGSGFTEQLEIVLKKIRIEDIDFQTGLEDLFTIKANFIAEWDQDQAGYVDVTVRNGKATDYT